MAVGGTFEIRDVARVCTAKKKNARKEVEDIIGNERYTAASFFFFSSYFSASSKFGICIRFSLVVSLHSGRAGGGVVANLSFIRGSSHGSYCIVLYTF